MNPRPAHRWTGWLVLAGAVALAGILLLQTLQSARLRELVGDTDEVRLAQMHSLETEFLQMRVEWMRALASGASPEARDLALRYDIWVGRAAMLRENTSMRRAALALDASLAPTLALVERFVQKADPVVHGMLPTAERRAALSALVPMLDELSDPLHDLALAASHQASAEKIARRLRLAENGRVNLALSAVLALLALSTLVFALRQSLRLAVAGKALRAASERARAAEGARDQAAHELARQLPASLTGLVSTLSGLQPSATASPASEPLRWAGQARPHPPAPLGSQALQAPLTRPVALRSLLNELCAVMTAPAEARGRRVRLQIDADLPDQVIVDEAALRQALVKLLHQALQGGERQPLRLHARRVSADVGGDSLDLSFEGCGPQPLHLDAGLAALLGARLDATDSAAATLRLPLLDPSNSGAAQPHDGPALRLLVAEGDADSRLALAGLIERLGHQAHFVSTGEEAVRSMQQGHFDLVLMDIHTPGLDGVEATRRIRALPLPDAATVPVVALTCDAFTDTREDCLVAGVNSFVAKPLSLDRLATLLRQLFGAQGRHRAAPTAVSPLIDVALVSRSFEGAARIDYAERLARFFDDVEPRLRDLRDAVRDAQPSRLHGLAQAARNAAAPLGLSALAETAGALCDGAASLPAHEVARLVQRFDDLLAASRSAARQSGLLERLVRG